MAAKTKQEHIDRCIVKKGRTCEHFLTNDENDEIKRIQELINTGMAWKLEGAVGRAAMRLLEAGLCELGEKRFTDYYGNVVPSRFDVKPGTKGAPLETR